MTIYFQDLFVGAGTLVNSHPTIKLNPAITTGWQVVTGYMLTRDGTGWVKVDGAVNDNYGQGILRFGTDNTDWGVTGSPPSSLYGPVTASFTVRTPPTLTGFGQNLIGIKLHLNGVLMTAAINHQYDKWWLRITGAADQEITGVIATDTVYHLVANFASGDSSVTVTELGITLYSPTAFTSSVGLSSVYACVTERGALGPVTVSMLVDTTPRAICTAPALLGAPRLLLRHDFTGQLGAATSVYVADLITPSGLVRVPISSWQATLRTDSSSYLQCVVPACTAWAASLNAATEFVVSRRVLLPSGQALEAEMARAPADNAQFDSGPQRATCTLSGYGGVLFAANPIPDSTLDRTLTGLRSVSSGSGGRRVRCAVDWLLRPGQRALVDGVPLLVGYINYYAPSGFDSYMDVGEQQ